MIQVEKVMVKIIPCKRELKSKKKRHSYSLFFR
jgi:hypothetical protein